MQAILKNWKTTGLGVLALVVTFVPIPVAFPKIQMLGVIVALGLFVSKDV